MVKATTPGMETRYPLYRRLGGAPGPVWTGAENLVPTGTFFLLFSVCTLSVLLCPGFSCTTHPTQTSMPPAGFEPAIPAGERPQTYALDRTATGIGRIRSPDRPGRSESLYQLSYPSPQNENETVCMSGTSLKGGCRYADSTGMEAYRHSKFR